MNNALRKVFLLMSLHINFLTYRWDNNIKICWILSRVVQVTIGMCEFDRVRDDGV